MGRAVCARSTLALTAHRETPVMRLRDSVRIWVLLLYVLLILGRGFGDAVEFLLLLVAIDVGNALLHPLRLGRALQEMIEELLQANGVVLLVGTAVDVVRLAVIVEQVDFLPQAAQREEQLESLVPWHRVIGVILQDQQRGD